MKETLHNHKVLFAKYDVWPEVPLPVLSSNTRHVTFCFLLILTILTLLLFNLPCFASVISDAGGVPLQIVGGKNMFMLNNNNNNNGLYLERVNISLHWRIHLFCFCVGLFHSSFGLVKYPNTNTTHEFSPDWSNTHLILLFYYNGNFNKRDLFQKHGKWSW